jgi:hypothetical protein
MCVNKKIKCELLHTNELTGEIIKYFDVTHFRCINADKIDCCLDGLFYCNVNQKNPKYNFLSNSKFIEGLKVIKDKVDNEDVLFEIFKKGYDPPIDYFKDMVIEHVYWPIYDLISR